MKKAFICGWPVEHSRSPIVHGFWLKQHGIDGDYGREGIKPEDFAGFISSLRAKGYAGGNITLPHKIEAARLADRLDYAAKAIGAVNTLWFENDGLVGSNTDGYGFIANLDQQAPGWDTGNPAAIVLGAGGAARAILHALLERGLTRIHLANRTVEKAGELAGAFGPAVHPVSMVEVPELLPDCGLLVNTTSVGMKDEGGFDFPLENMPSAAVVSDIVYVPLETGLLRDAAKAGLRTVDGLGMLLHQAVPGFEKWFGVRPEVTGELRRAVLADLGL